METVREQEMMQLVQAIETVTKESIAEEDESANEGKRKFYKRFATFINQIELEHSPERKLYFMIQLFDYILNHIHFVTEQIKDSILYKIEHLRMELSEMMEEGSIKPTEKVDAFHEVINHLEKALTSDSHGPVLK